MFDVLVSVGRACLQWHIGVVIQDGDGTTGRLRGGVITGTGITQCEIGCCGFTATAIVTRSLSRWPTL